MRWYVNDISLQGQFVDGQGFEAAIRNLLSARARIASLRAGLFTTRTLRERHVSPATTVRETIQRSSDRDFRRAVLGWLDHNGPFFEDDRFPENDDYFEFDGADVTDTGLGEAARRARANQPVGSFSFAGGSRSFEYSPLKVDHGLSEDRLGNYGVDNFWTIDQLTSSAIAVGPRIASWKGLIESARERFPLLVVPDAIHENALLVREPFEPTIRDRTLVLLGHLNRYMSDRAPDGAEGEAARSIIDNFFAGERALFTGESQSNQARFRRELTFDDPEAAGRTIFAHWHGKISHRVFRLHFEWPVPAGATRLKVLYLGPKLTKS